MCRIISIRKRWGAGPPSRASPYNTWYSTLFPCEMLIKWWEAFKQQSYFIDLPQVYYLINAFASFFQSKYLLDLLNTSYWSSVLLARRSGVHKYPYYIQRTSQQARRNIYHKEHHVITGNSGWFRAGKIASWCLVECVVCLLYFSFHIFKVRWILASCLVVMNNGRKNRTH